jgi:hypothetical protein
MAQDIAIKTQTLPDTVEDLHKFVLVGREKLQAQMALIRAIDKAEVAKEVRDAALLDAQNMAEAVLRAEVKMGEILKTIPQKYESSGRGRIDKQKKLPEGITYKQSHYAQTLASHPHAIDQALEQAKKREEVPTRAAVLRVIKREINPPNPRTPKSKSNETNSPELKSGRPIMSQSFRNALDELKREIICAIDSNWKETNKQTALSYLNSLINIIKHQKEA